VHISKLLSVGESSPRKSRTDADAQGRADDGFSSVVWKASEPATVVAVSELYANQRKLGVSDVERSSSPDTGARTKTFLCRPSVWLSTVLSLLRHT
jgi:hypothetical protein